MDTTGKIKRKKNETTLREAVVGSVERFYELHGLEVAIQKFDEMKVLFSGSRDWPDIDKEVTAFFLEKKRQAQEPYADWVLEYIRLHSGNAPVE